MGKFSVGQKVRYDGNNNALKDFIGKIEFIVEEIYVPGSPTNFGEINCSGKNIYRVYSQKARQLFIFTEDELAAVNDDDETLNSGILTVARDSKDPEKAFKAKWDGIDREDMTDEQLTAFMEDCFTLYETTGFADTIRSPYTDQSSHNGKPFKVIRRATTEECDMESMPQWVVKIEGSDEEVFCFPEEICKLERK